MVNMGERGATAQHVGESQPEIVSGSPRFDGSIPSSPDLIEAMSLAHRAEVNRLAMQLLLYRTALEEAGIDPPDASAEDLLEMWRRCMAIVQHANEFVTGLGSAKELLEAWS